MTALSVLAMALAPVLAAPELGFMERTELRLRNPGDAVDAEQWAGARLRLVMPRQTFSLSYLPRLSFTDVFYDVTVDLLHAAELTADFEWRKARLSFAERAAYGTRSFTALTPAQDDVVIGNPGQRIVTVTGPVDYGSSDTTLTLTLDLGRRSDLELSGGYLFDGGLDDEAKAVIPFVHGPRARVEWRYQLARRDTLGSALEGERLYSDDGFDDTELRSDLVRWRERWAHQWSPGTTTELSAGAAVARTTALDDGAEWYAIGSGSLSKTMRTGPNAEFLNLETLVQVDVTIDRLVGLPDQRLDVALRGTWTRDPYTLFAGLGHTQSLRWDEPNSLVLYSGDVGARYQWTRALMWEGGFRAAYQTVRAPTTTATASAAEGFNWVVLVALQAQTDSFERRRVSAADEKESEDP